MDIKNKVICIQGPTASGKTALAVELAKRLDGEVICADSMQIYKGIHIASAAPDDDEMQGIKHYMLEFLSLGEKYTVAEYVAAARECIESTVKRGKTPIVAGGTGLYISALADNISYIEQKTDYDLRERLYAEYDRSGGEEMLKRLEALDPDAASLLHPNDRRRIVRAFEIYESTGKTKTVQNKLSKLNESPYDFIMIGINYRDREKLYDRINKRVDIMLENGLVNEARAVYEKKELIKNSGALQAIGHKELFAYFEGRITLTEAAENLKQSTRRYAKRQLTWFRRDGRINWIYPDVTPDTVSEALKVIERNLKNG